MIFGNPLLAELHLIFSTMKELKNDLLVLEDETIFENKEQVKRVFKNLRFLLDHLKNYSQKELELFSKEEVSKNCTNLIQGIKKVYINFDRIARWGEVPTRNPFPNIRKLIEQIETIEKEIIKAKHTLKFEVKQKRRAKRLAKPQLSLKEIGCYHHAPIGRILHIFRNGLISADFALSEFSHALELTLEGWQGNSYISVYDPYSYFKLYEFFLAKGLLESIERGIISETNLMEAFRANQELNFFKFSKENIKIWQDHGIFKGNTMNLRTFQSTMADIAGGVLNTTELGNFGRSDVTFLINDTAHFFPEHANAYEFEARFIGRVKPNKIVGVIVSKKTYQTQIEEFVKFAGIPLYDMSGQLIWPLK